MEMFSWLEEFKAVTIKTTCIELSNEFLDYLQSDGIILPKCSKVVMLGRDELSDDEDLKPEENPVVNEAPEFYDLNTAIDNIIGEYGGKVFVKFHTKAPIDAGWINGGNLACQTSGDVYMLLKSSSKVCECVEDVRARSVTPVLLVRKWANLHPSMEFRCFVHHRYLVGICQRNCADYFEYLSDCEEIDRLRDIIVKFYISRIKNVYFDQSYTFDIYVDKKDRVWIIDFDTFGTTTVNPLLFTWTQLEQNYTRMLDVPNDNEVEVPFVVVLDERDRLPYELGSSRGPIDLVEIPDAVQMMMSLVNRRNYHKNFSSDEESDDQV